MQSHLLWALSLALFAATLLPFWTEAFFKRVDFLDARVLVLAYYLLQYPVWAVAILLTEQTKWPIELNDSFTTSLVYALVGILAFHAGYLVPVKVGLPTIAVPWRRVRVVALVVTSFAIGLSCFLWLMHSVGGMDEYLANREFYRAEGLVGKGYAVFGASTLLFVPVLLTYGWTRRLAHPVVLGFMAVWAFAVLVVGYRSLLLLPLVQLMLIRHHLIAPVRLRTACFAGVALVLLMASIAFWREAQSYPVEVVVEAVNAETVGTAFQSLVLSRSHGIEIVAVVLDAMRWGDGPAFDWGLNSLIEVVSVPIPRAWWPDKIDSVSFRFAGDFFRDYITWSDTAQGVSPGIIAELYWHFSLLGPTIGMFVFGMALRAVTIWRARYNDNVNAAILYSYVSVAAFFIVEAPTVALNGWLPQLGVVTLALLFLSRWRLVRDS